jgi:hypothetical protein
MGLACSRSENREASMSTEWRANIISALIFLGLAFAFAHSFGIL